MDLLDSTEILVPGRQWKIVGQFPKRVAGLRLINFNGLVLSFGQFYLSFNELRVFFCNTYEIQVVMSREHLVTNSSIRFSSIILRNRHGRTIP